jgi:transposase-like protein
LVKVRAYGRVSGMSTTSNPYRGFRFPAEIINQAVWLYHCFSLSLREVELILAARGIVVSYETHPRIEPPLRTDLREVAQAASATSRRQMVSR